jgi:hypothetical protein
MDEVAQSDFRTDAEQEEYDGVLPRAEVVRVASLLVEETVAGKYGGEIREASRKSCHTELPISPKLRQGLALTIAPIAVKCRQDSSLL